MFEALFGAEMPLAVRFFLAFLIVLGLIGATAWAVRRFGAGRLGGAAMRGRQPRLAVIDSTAVDGRRRLVLVRRDNVEHLLMIGGPTDVVVEPNIVRAVAASRDAPAARPAGPAETLPRAIPLPETGSWPLQPEPMGAPRPGPRMEPPEDPAWPLQPQNDAPSRSPRDTLAALADELGTRPAPARNRVPGAPRSQPVEPRAEPRQESRREARVEPRITAVPSANGEAASNTDQGVVEMAHRLEAALRKPNAAPASPAVEPPAAQRPSPPAEQPEIAEQAQPAAPARAPRNGEAKPARELKASQGKALYDSLEQEMASLLGRPASKT